MYVKLNIGFYTLLIWLWCNLATAHASTITAVAKPPTVTPISKTFLPIERWVTSTGTTVYFVRTEGLPIVDIQLLFDAGAARDEQQFGLAKLTNTLLSQGSNTHSADEWATSLAKTGAVYSAFTGRDLALLSLRSLTNEPQLTQALDLFHEILTRPNFNDSTLIREKNNQLQAILAEQQSPQAIANTAFYQALYGTHPYAHSILGIETTVKPLTVAQVKAFYKQYYVNHNMTLIIVGEVTKARADAIAQLLTQDLPVGKAPNPLALAQPLKQTPIKIVFPSAQSHILIGQVAIRRDDPRYPAWFVANNILGGNTFASLLFKNVREKNGYAYSVYSNLIPMRNGGPLMIGLQSKTATTNAALSIAMQTLRHFIQQGPTDAQLTTAKKNIIGALPLALDSNAAIAMMVGMIGFYHLPLDYLEKFQKNILQLKIAEVKQAFHQLIDPNQVACIVVGQKATPITKEHAK